MMHVVCGTYVPGLAYKKRARVKGQQYPDRHEWMNEMTGAIVFALLH